MYDCEVEGGLYVQDDVGGLLFACVRMYAWARISFALATESHTVFFIPQLIPFQCLNH